MDGWDSRFPDLDFSSGAEKTEARQTSPGTIVNEEAESNCQTGTSGVDLRRKNLGTISALPIVN